MISLKTKHIIVLIAGLLILIMSLSADYIRTGSMHSFGIKQIAGIIIGATLFFRGLILNYRRITTVTVYSQKYSVPVESSFWLLFRLVYTIFFLYLIGDAFYRWDGFRYHSSLFEFLHNLTLITTLWGIISFFISLIIWSIFRIDEWISGIETNSALKRLFIFVFLFSGAAVWLIKSPVLDWTFSDIKLTKAVFYLFLLSILFTWFTRKKSVKWINIIDERITPLVWGFGIAFVISLLIVISQLLLHQPKHKIFNGNPDTTTMISKKGTPNILLVTFDALTAENMSVYGYQRKTTPFLEKWGGRASLFSNVQSESNTTRPTTTSLMTGKRFWTHLTYHETYGKQGLNVQTENLPLLLKNHGYYNLAFIANDYASVDSLGLNNNFHIAPKFKEFVNANSLSTFIDLTLYRLFSDRYRLHNWLISEDFIFRALLLTFSKFEKKMPIDKTVNRFFEVIDSNLREPFFAWIHLWPPHAPYEPPSSYRGLFTDSITSESKSVEDKERMSYDEYVRYCDKELESFMKQVELRDWSKNTIIIVSSDHGEAFKEDHPGHGEYFLYNAETHIPLIIKEPGQSNGKVIHALINQIDIPATILDLAHIPVPPWMEGRSLVPYMRGEKVSPRPVFSMALKLNPNRQLKIKKGTIALWHGDYKLIHYLDNQETLLYNLEKDPEELQNLFNENHEIGNQLKDLLLENLTTANNRLP